MKRRAFLRVPLAAVSAVPPAPTLGLLALAGCAAAPPLRVATHDFPGYQFLFLGRELGFLDGGEDSVHLVDTPSASVSSRALLHGLVDAAALTLDEALVLLAKGLALSVVLLFDYSAGADKLLARERYRRLADLAGSRIGVEVGAVGALLLDAALAAGGLSVADIRLVPLPLDRHLAAWRAGEVDALISFDPVAAAVQAAGGRVLFDSRAIPGRIVDVLAVRQDALAQRGDGVRRLLKAHFAAQGHYAVHAAEDAARVAPRVMRLALFDGLHLTTLEENREALGPPRQLLRVSAQDLAGFMLTRRLLHRVPDLAGVFRPDFLPDV